MIGYNRQKKVTDTFSQKNLTMRQMGNLDQIALNLCNFISHDPNFGNLDPTWTKIVLSYISWSDLHFFEERIIITVHNK